MPSLDLDNIQTITEWGVAWTRSRCEKLLDEFLASAQIPAYLPLFANRRTYGSRIRVSEIPLFPGYIFFHHSNENARKVLQSGMAVQVLRPPCSFQLGMELLGVAKALKADCNLRATRFKRTGMLVEVNAGPLKGVTGHLVRLISGCRLLIAVSFLGKAVELEIDESVVSPI